MGSGAGSAAAAASPASGSATSCGGDAVSELLTADGGEAPRPGWREAVFEAQRKRDALLEAVLKKHRAAAGADNPWNAPFKP